MKNISLKEFIHRDPHISHGKPCFRIDGQPSRLMVWIVLELLQDGASYEDIMKEYPELTHDHIRAALQYAAEIAKNSEYLAFDRAD